MPTESPTLIQTLLSPPVLVTFIVCAGLAALVIWLAVKWQRHQANVSLAQQRQMQEGTIERLLNSVAEDKEKIIAEYEERVSQREARIAELEREVSRLRDRLSSSGVLGLFGGKQRDVLGALLLENEQLHELLAQKQEQMRDLMADMTDKLLSRMDEQAQESAHAVRYKQALLSAFLQHTEARELLDRLLAEGRLGATEQEAPPAQLPPEPSQEP
ncbi:MAG: hypothetical protein JXA74_08480 [Anaerolineae bacterium]|nr:hypothetical protein [Anaerolineae bacterium]